MDKFAIVGSSKQRRVGYIVAIVGALLSEFAVAVPAQSADFYPPLGPGPTYYQGAAFRPNCFPCGCNPCGCNPCGCSQCGCCGPVVQRRVIERHWVEREYFERVGCCRTSGYGDGYPYGGPGYGGPGYGGPRPFLGYGGVNYAPYPPAGIPGPYYTAGYAE